MGADLSKVSMLTRREIEARIAGPLTHAFMEKMGKDAAIKIVSSVMKKLARESGNRLAKKMGGNSVQDLVEGTETFSAGDAIVISPLEVSNTKYCFNVTTCRYAEMYKEQGMADIGYILSCGRDFALYKGFNPRMKLKRTQTIMEGHDYCDFRIAIE